MTLKKCFIFFVSLFLFISFRAAHTAEDLLDKDNAAADKSKKAVKSGKKTRKEYESSLHQKKPDPSLLKVTKVPQSKTKKATPAKKQAKKQKKSKPAASKKKATDKSKVTRAKGKDTQAKAKPAKSKKTEKKSKPPSRKKASKEKKRKKHRPISSIKNPLLLGLVENVPQTSTPTAKTPAASVAAAQTSVTTIKAPGATSITTPAKPGSTTAPTQPTRTETPTPATEQPQPIKINTKKLQSVKNTLIARALKLYVEQPKKVPADVVSLAEDLDALAGSLGNKLEDDKGQLAKKIKLPFAKATAGFRVAFDYDDDTKKTPAERTTFGIETTCKATIPLIGPCDAEYFWGFQNDKRLHKFTVKGALKFFNLTINPAVILVEEEDTIILTGHTTIFDKDVDVRCTISKNAKKIQNPHAFYKDGYFIDFEGTVDLKDFKPLESPLFSQILTAQFPAELKNIVLNNVKVSGFWSEGLNFALIGKATIYNIPTTVGFYLSVAERDQKSQATIQRNRVAMQVTFDEEMSFAKLGRMVSADAMKLLPPPSIAMLDVLKCKAPGFLISASTTPFTMYYLTPKKGITIYQEKGSRPVNLTNGLHLCGELYLEGELTKLNNYFNALERSVFFVGSIAPSLKGTGFKCLIANGKFNYSIPGFKIDPAPYIVEFNLEPSLAVILGLSILPDGQKEPITFSGKAALGLTKIKVALSMDGTWQKAFGINALSIGNLAGELYFDATLKNIGAVAGGATGAAAGGAAGLAATAGLDLGAAALIGAGVGGAAGAVGGHALMPLVPSGIGLSFEAALGQEGSPKKKSMLIATVLTAHLGDLALLARLNGSYAITDMVDLFSQIDVIAQAIQATRKFMAKVVPLQVGKAPAGSGAEEKAKTFQPFDIKELEGTPDTNALLENISSYNKPVIKGQDQILRLVKGANAFAQNMKSKLATLFANLPANTKLINPEIRIAPDYITVGTLMFPRGFVLKGILEIFGQRAGVNFAFDFFDETTGIIGEAYLPKLDLGYIATLNDGFKDQVTLEGRGPGNGPIFGAYLTTKRQAYVLSGKASMKQLQAAGEVDIELSSDGFIYKLESKIFNLFGAAIDCRAQLSTKTFSYKAYVKDEFKTYLKELISDAAGKL